MRIASLPPLLEVHGFLRRFPTGRCIAVPHFEVCRGDFVLFHGPTGCGKTTVLNAFALLDIPTLVKRFVFDGIDLCGASDRQLNAIRRRRIAFAPQRPELLAALTPRENVEVPQRLNGELDGRARVDYLLDAFGVPDDRHGSDLLGIADHLATTLSGGQQLRVGLARALVHQPDLVLLDECTASLDEATAKRCLDVLDRLRRDEGLTIVMVSHDEPLTRPYATQIVRMACKSPRISHVVSVERRALPGDAVPSASTYPATEGVPR